MSDVIGRPPTPDDAMLIGDVQRFAPSKTMERLDTHAKYLFSGITIFGTLIADFDLFKPDRVTAWVVLPVALLAISLALAMLAITPTFRKLTLSRAEP